eukprot:GHVN01097376.1.p2 GENE.GHVN01097376.1~~GHVN01097376.1.p2  ORF type:complete len:524 (-),score=69.62 GHVN01097376.1:3073-4644(-)
MGVCLDQLFLRLTSLCSDKPDAKKLEEMRKEPHKPVRIQPDRRWFGNTRVVTQTKLATFREEINKANADPYSVVVKRRSLPMSLINDGLEKNPHGTVTTRDTKKAARMNLLSIEPHHHVFSAKTRRKRPRLAINDLEGVLNKAARASEDYDTLKDKSALTDAPDTTPEVSEEIMKKGTSRRIWQELYKVIDSSDVVVQVIDARDPMGTRCKAIERHIRNERSHKHFILLLNKVDLIPSWATARWVKVLSAQYPTVAFHASITNPFGKNTLLNLLRQFSALLSNRQHVSVGFIGYPNVGKSSVINTLRKKRVCKAAPVPGETKIWQYVSLTNRVHLIDCPGVFPNDPGETDDASKVLKGVIRAERMEAPEHYIDDVLAKLKKRDVLKRYKLPKHTKWRNGFEFLAILSRKMGKLRKGGEADVSIAARIVLYDWQRGRLPFFTQPPFGNKENPRYTADPLVGCVNTMNDNDDDEGLEVEEDKVEEVANWDATRRELETMGLDKVVDGENNNDVTQENSEIGGADD